MIEYNRGHLKIYMNIKVRIAPSPTGFLHVGTARTALFNWVFARHNNGKFILRIEDTDKERSDKKYEEDILEELKWLGLEWDKMYRQSERTDIYKKYIEKLLNEKKAFWCFHSPEELEKEKREQMKAKEAPRHLCSYKYEKKEGGEGGIIRLAVDEKSDRVVKFDDVIRGEVEWKENLIGDFSIAKDSSTPLYNFAAIIDDVDMKISHVIRGEDHISNTPKQILIAEALEFNIPKYAHLPLILGTDRSKLSKRHGTTSVGEYREQGFLADAMVNFLALLGWAPGNNEEIFSREELIKRFQLEDVHKGGAVFDVKKLEWMNGEYIKAMPKEKLQEVLITFAEKHFGKDFSKNVLEKIMPMVQERIETLDQIGEFHFFFKEPKYEKDLLTWKKGSAQQAKEALELTKGTLSTKIDDWKKFDEQKIKSELDKLAQEKFAGDRGMVYWPLRIALSGEKFSPDPVQIMSALTKDVVLGRIEKALQI